MLKGVGMTVPKTKEFKKQVQYNICGKAGGGTIHIYKSILPTLRDLCIETLVSHFMCLKGFVHEF